MSEREWTSKQKQCIDAGNGTLLVSAAAGSGKTAVLIERIFNRITREKDPLSVDHLLVVTFTRSAAAEMRDRLSSRIMDALEKNPKDSLLRRQLLLLPSAYITTTDAFCADLLREHASLVNLSPNFTVLDEADSHALLSESVDEIMEEMYGDGSGELASLANHYLGEDRNDDSLKRLIETTYYFLQSSAYPKEWLQKQVKDLDLKTPIKDTSWYSFFKSQLLSLLNDCLDQLNTGIILCGYDEKTTTNYLPSFREFYNGLTHLKENVDAFSINEQIRYLLSFQVPSLKSIRGDNPVKDVAKKYRDNAKKALDKFCKELPVSEDEINEDRKTIYPLLCTLSKAVLKTAETFEGKKQEKDAIDYSDMSRYALRLLIQRENGTSVASPVAKELQERFDEIYVDEYQDTNEIQDTIYSAISRDESNLFYVGDVKQSIYAFRKARPDLFLKRRDSYRDYDGEHFPATITLDANFRSRKTVTSITNFVFSQIMTKDSSGIDYRHGEQLTYGASKNYDYIPDDEYATEFLLINQEKQKNEVIPHLEAQAIAQKIKSIVGHLTIRVSENESRPVEYHDICILLRNKKNVINNYYTELKNLGIPVVCEQSIDFLSASEVALSLSFLRAIDNPLEDIPLVAIMLSIIGGFTVDELAEVRTKQRRTKYIYSALHHLKKEDSPLGRKISGFIDMMERYRIMAATIPAYQILDLMYRETSLLSLVATKELGDQRAANLRALYNISFGFEKDGFKGLSAFVHYIDALESNESFSTAITLPAAQNAVQISTMHSSKGLEYPVVFLANLSHEFNTMDTRANCLRHVNAGIGFAYVNPNNRVLSKSIMHKVVANALTQQIREEEMRLLYVAMTRAKEKLYLVGSLKNLDTYLKDLSSPFNEDTLPSFVPNQCKNHLQWLLQSLVRHEQANCLREENGEFVRLKPSDALLHVERFVCEEDEAPVEEKKELTFEKADEQKVNTLLSHIDFCSPYRPLANLSNKLTASEFSRSGQNKHRFLGTSKPAFMEKGLSGAAQGTALHRFMQHSDWSKDGEHYDFEKEISRLLSSGKLNEQQADYIRGHLREIRFFFESELYKRMQKSSRYWKELPFNVYIEAKKLYTADQIKDIEVPIEDVLVQGVVDCAFEENGKIIIVDYKSDFVEQAEDLLENYSDQIQLYALALEKVFELPVTECYLYSLGVGEAVKVPITL